MKFALSLAEQGFGSLLTFGVNLWLIRNGAASAYGAYVFWLSVAFVGGVVEGTLVLAHLSRLPSAKDRMAERRDPERFMLTVTLGVLTAVTLAVTVGEQILAQAGSDLATPAAIVFIPAFLLFQYVRTFAFSRQRPALAALLSAGILLATILGLGIDYALGDRPTAGRVLLVTGLAFGGVSTAVLLVLLRGVGPMLRLDDLRRQARTIHGFAWLMLGAGSNEVTGRLYSFVTVGRFGTEALALMSAVQVVIRPAALLCSAWMSIGFPEIAGRWARGDRNGVIRAMAAGAAMTAGGGVVWSAIVVQGWPWISSTLYHGKYAEIGPLGVLWGINVVLSGFGVVLNTASLAVGEFRRLALIDLAGAVVTVAALGVVVTSFSYPYAVVATILGQATQIALMAMLMQRRLRTPGIAIASPQPG